MLPDHSSGIVLGPYFRTVADRARWRDDPAETTFPSRQYIAEEYERYLAFADYHGQWERYLPRLVKNAQHRDAAIAEIAVAFMFTRDGFPVIEWEPVGKGTKRGEFSIDGGVEAPIFVEVKAPGWHSELSAEERDLRKTRPKYIDGEAHFVADKSALRHSVTQAAEKMTGDVPSLLVVVDDLFLGYRDNRWACDTALYSPRGSVDSEGRPDEGCFVTAAHACVGGVMVVWYDRREDRLFSQSAFGRRLYRNRFASQRALLPIRFSSAYDARDRAQWDLTE
jgi:hypothetical protein